MIFSPPWLDPTFSYPGSPNSPAITQIRGARTIRVADPDPVLESNIGYGIGSFVGSDPVFFRKVGSGADV